MYLIKIIAIFFEMLLLIITIPFELTKGRKRKKRKLIKKYFFCLKGL
jgi:hypothetical protein